MTSFFEQVHRYQNRYRFEIEKRWSFIWTPYMARNYQTSVRSRPDLQLWIIIVSQVRSSLAV